MSPTLPTHYPGRPPCHGTCCGHCFTSVSHSLLCVLSWDFLVLRQFCVSVTGPEVTCPDDGHAKSRPTSRAQTGGSCSHHTSHPV